MKKSKLKTKITVRGMFVPYTGYGQLVIDTVKGLINLGFDVKARVEHLNEGFGSSVPLSVKECFVFKEQQDTDFELVIHPPSFEPADNVNRVHWTMWESDELPEEYVTLLNKSKMVLNPTLWGCKAFKNDGVNVPIVKVPLGVCHRVYKPDVTMLPSTSPFVFGCSGRVAHGGVRKGIDQVIRVFKKTFNKSNTDVMLKVKIFPDCYIEEPYEDDPRIQVTRAYVNDCSMAQWYNSLNCYITASKSEGFGLQVLESMMCGKPVIGPYNSGYMDFVTPDVNFYEVACGYWKPSNFDIYKGKGTWAYPIDESLSERMREVIRHPLECFTRGLKAREQVKHLTKDNMVKELVTVLKLKGFLK